MTGAGAAREGILLATAAAIVGLFALLNFLPPLLSELGRGSSWLWALYGIVLLVPVALLIPAVVWPRSVTAAVVAALSVCVLLIWGMSLQPVPRPRVLIHFAPLQCPAAPVSPALRADAGLTLRL